MESGLIFCKTYPPYLIIIYFLRGVQTSYSSYTHWLGAARAGWEPHRRSRLAAASSSILIKS